MLPKLSGDCLISFHLWHVIYLPQAFKVICESFSFDVCNGHRIPNVKIIHFTFVAQIPSDEQNLVIQHQRRLEIQQRQELYQWGDDPAYSVDLPGFIKASNPKSLPKDVQFTSEAANTLHTAKRAALANLGLGKLFNVFSSWKNIDDFRSMFTSLLGDPPPAAKHWHTDVWNGKQFLNGCNPDTIKRCKELPTNFPVTNEMVSDVLDPGVTLEQAMKVR